MIHGSFEESHRNSIHLKDVTAPVFGAFMIWLHSWQPSKALRDLDIALLIDVAIFADLYNLDELHNDALDELSGHYILPNEALLRYVYDHTRKGAPLRKFMVANLIRPGGGRTNNLDWIHLKSTLQEVEDICFDILKYEHFDAEISEDDPCYFHWHEEDDYPATSPGYTIVCPFGRRRHQNMEGMPFTYDADTILSQHKKRKGDQCDSSSTTDQDDDEGLKPPESKRTKVSENLSDEAGEDSSDGSKTAEVIADEVPDMRAKV